MKQYKVYYSARINGEDVERDIVVTAVGPIAALDFFHKTMQLTDSKMTTTGVVTRPKLKPNEYKLIGLYDFYRDSPVHLGGSGQMIQSKIDLPSSPNPDVRYPEATTRLEATIEMELNDDRRRPADFSN